MASSSISRSGRMTYLSPERTKIWTEPSNSKLKSDRKVPVVYYLSRNGQLEHPHFMEVTLSSHRGLFLSDVLNRLNALRGKGMASLYSWSCKRSYRNGFVWHDLSDEDFIYPTHGNEYVLKGSDLELSIQESPIAVRRRKNQSCSSIDFNNSLNEYHNVYQAEIPDRSTDAADASTQTDDLRKLQRMKQAEIVEVKEEDEIEVISPPSTDSSPETLEKLMKVDKRLILGAENPTASSQANARKSSVLMQLISCGSLSFKDCGPSGGLMSHYKMRLPRGGGTGGSGRVKLEDKEYFSGSLVETKKPEFPALKRSTSYNADGRSKMELPNREIDGVGAKCMHRKLKTATSTKKEEITQLSCDSSFH